MSIILKALKKTDASATRKKLPLMRAAFTDKKSKWLVVPVALCAVLLVAVFAIYLLKDNIQAPKRRAGVITTTKASVAPTTNAADINRMAIAHLRASRYEEAEKLILDALPRYPAEPELLNHLGLAQKRQGRAKDAASSYIKALMLKPDYHEAMNNLAVTYEALGDLRAAERLYVKVLDENPSIAEVHLNYALLLQSTGRTSEAESRYHTFLTLSSDDTLKGMVRRRLRSLK